MAVRAGYAGADLAPLVKRLLTFIANRNKWTETQPSVKVNDLVSVKNPQLPPSKWELARIVEVHPSSDGQVRVVTVRTACTLYKRPITQICKLPMHTERDALKNKTT